MEKIGNLEKRLEIWKEIENLENIWKFEKINLKIWEKMEIWKKVKGFEQNLVILKFYKKIETGDEFVLKGFLPWVSNGKED